MVKIRLFRTGAKKTPSYRVVIADARAPRDGRFIEIIGHYNPRTDPVVAEIHEDRALYWLSVGAQPTDQVSKILKNLGTLDRFAQVKQGAALEEVLAAAAQEKLEQTSAKPRKKAVVAAPVEKPGKTVESDLEVTAEKTTAKEATEEAVAEVLEEVSSEVADEVISEEDES